MFKSTLVVLLAASLLAPGLAEAKTRKTTAKTASTSSKKKGASSKKSNTRTTRARRTGPPRQAAPTPQRYMEIQQALAAKGYYSGPVDGNWDATCVDALKRFQADQSLSPDGKLGALSLIALGLGPKREPLAQQLPAKTEQ